MKNDMQVSDNTVTCKWHIKGNTDQLIAAMNSSHLRLNKAACFLI